MTVIASTSTVDLLSERLRTLQTQRSALRAESALPGSGDVADRTADVGAVIRLELLDERIASVELEIQEATHQRHTEGVVSVGDVVTLDLGEGPESYLLGSVEQAGPGVDTVTPGSPLGQAIVDARVGSTVHYRAGRGRTLEAIVIAAEALASAD